MASQQEGRIEADDENVKILQFMMDKYGSLAASIIMPLVTTTEWSTILKTFTSLNQLDKWIAQNQIDADQLRDQFRKLFDGFGSDFTGGSSILNKIYHSISVFISTAGPMVNFAEMHRIIQNGQSATIEMFFTQQLIVSSKVIAGQIIKLSKIWAELEKAENLIKKTDQVKENIGKLEFEITDIETELAKWHSIYLKGEEIVDNEKLKALFKRIMALTPLYTTTLGLIANLEIYIGGSIHTLDEHIADKDKSTYMHIGGVLSHISLFAIPVLTTVPFTAPFVVSNLSFIALHSALFYIGTKTYKITEKRLQELKTAFNELKQMSAKLLGEIEKDIEKLEYMYQHYSSSE